MQYQNILKTVRADNFKIMKILYDGLTEASYIPDECCDLTVENIMDVQVLKDIQEVLREDINLMNSSICQSQELYRKISRHLKYARAVARQKKAYEHYCNHTGQIIKRCDVCSKDYKNNSFANHLKSKCHLNKLLENHSN